jgi:hypothetical protein
MDEHATFSFGFFGGGGPKTTTTRGRPEDDDEQVPAAAASSLQPDPQAPSLSSPVPPRPAAAAALPPLPERELTMPLSSSAPGTSSAALPIEVAPGVSLLKGIVAGEAAAAALAGRGARRRSDKEEQEDEQPAAAPQPLLAKSDLVKGAYEGGFKLWEGALDLCAYLVAPRPSPDAEGGDDAAPSPLARLALAAAAASASGSAKPRVLELGCGHGLPGLLCLLAGADVDFQDYNAEVLEQLTWPNVQANLASAEVVAAVRRAVVVGSGSGDSSSSAALPPPPPGRARYFAGDWSGLPALLSRRDDEEEEKQEGEREQQQQQGGGEQRQQHHPQPRPHCRYYDLVLTAETLYDADAGQEALLGVLEASVGPPPSAALVASKTYYFGVGGGTQQFRARLRERAAAGTGAARTGPGAATNPPLAVVEARSTVLQDGASNRREVLWLERAGGGQG